MYICNHNKGGSMGKRGVNAGNCRQTIKRTFGEEVGICWGPLYICGVESLLKGSNFILQRRIGS